MYVVGKSPKPTAEIRQRKFPIVFFCFFFPIKKCQLSKRDRVFRVSSETPIFGYTLGESYFVNTLFWHLAILYLPLCLSYFPTAVCVFAPRHHLHLYPLPPLATSHLLDLIEFFPEEEMFPPNESVEILHSDKHDPIFRLIKERASSLFLAFSSHLFAAVPSSPFVSSFFFCSTTFGCALSAFL